MFKKIQFISRGFFTFTANSFYSCIKVSLKNLDKMMKAKHRLTYSICDIQEHKYDKNWFASYKQLKVMTKTEEE